jgi:hypothetical protein
VTEKPAGGAPVQDILIVGVGSSVLVLLVFALIYAYRGGGARPLRTLMQLTERITGVPGWASLPGLSAVGGAIITIWGATWDIGVHIDLGRDEGPLGTPAHYPLLVGLLWMMLMGLLAVGLTPQDRRVSGAAFNVPGLGAVPAGALLLAVASSFAMIGFPLDDLWHRIFGQDVTLWGPTHTMFIGGVLAAGVGAALLLAEGARAAGKEPFGRRGILSMPIAALLAAIFLYLWTAALDEFNWGVPQYRQVWHPLILAFGGAHTLVLARLLGGRGGTLAALVLFLPMQIAMTLVIGGPLERTMPAMPLFLAEAVLIELLAARGDWKSPVRFGLVAGLGVGTIGCAANYGWSHVVYPLPWETGLLAEAIPVAIAAGLAGGVLGALMAQALRGRLDAVRAPLGLAVVAAAVALGLAANAGVASAPNGLTATTTLTNVSGGRADVTVRFSVPDVARDANWVQALAWQGGGRFSDRMVPAGDGTFRSTRPVPIAGTWKSFVRLHAGRVMVAAPLRMPADPAVDFAGFAAKPQATRAMVRDTTLLQIERKDDGPGWAWTPAMLLVLACDLALLVFMAVICVRIGRMAGPPKQRARPHMTTRPARVEVTA